jgi:hypothetical protein
VVIKPPYQGNVICFPLKKAHFFTPLLPFTTSLRNSWDLQAALGEIFSSHSQACLHDFSRELLVLDLDLSPLPASSAAEGSERGYMGRSRSKTGRKLVRVRAADTHEIVWETVITGRRVESLPVLQEAIYGMESRLGLQGTDASTLCETQAHRDPPG